jgi:hypothetical protein
MERRQINLALNTIRYLYFTLIYLFIFVNCLAIIVSKSKYIQTVDYMFYIEMIIYITTAIIYKISSSNYMKCLASLFVSSAAVVRVLHFFYIYGVENAIYMYKIYPNVWVQLTWYFIVILLGIIVSFIYLAKHKHEGASGTETVR